MYTTPTKITFVDSSRNEKKKPETPKCKEREVETVHNEMEKKNMERRDRHARYAIEYRTGLQS